MSKRLLVIMLLLMAPLAAQAADGSAADPSSVVPQIPSALSQSQTSPSTDSPGSTFGPAAGSEGSSNLSASSLQPAGGSPLQSDPNNSSGMTAPADNNLQTSSTVSDDALKVVQNDLDGEPHTTAATSSNANWLWLIFVIPLGLIVGGSYYVLRRREQAAGY